MYGDHRAKFHVLLHDGINLFHCLIILQAKPGLKFKVTYDDLSIKNKIYLQIFSENLPNPFK